MLARMLTALVGKRRAESPPAVSADQDVLVGEAKALIEAADLVAAEAKLRERVRNRPDGAEAYRLLGSVLGAMGRTQEAQDLLEHAVKLDPDNAAGWVLLGNAYRFSGRVADAECNYRRALELDPSSAAARFGVASIDESLGRHDVAKEVYRTLLEPPAFVPALQALIRLLDRLGQVEEAKRACESVLRREPEHGAALAGLGFLLLKRELKPSAALEHFERALQAGYGNEDVLANRGIALQDLGRLDAAVASYDAALRMRSDYHPACFHRGLALLMSGDFSRGWSDYESRLVSEDAAVAPRSLPRWNGECLPDTPLLVYGEQGIGDEIMFASCLPDLMRQCPRIVLTCAAKLEPIMRRSFPTAEVIGADSMGEARAMRLLDQAVAAVAIGSLPFYFRPTLAHFPRHDGYLRADPELIAHYRERLRALGSDPKIGISWRGGTPRSRQSLRTLRTDHVRAILETPGTTFVNLQYDSAGDEPEIADAIISGRLVHWPEVLGDYDHTAAAVCALDVVVTVCTAVNHLAGALGRPVWIMAPFSPEWRYGISGEAMPWYPTATIIRQSSRGDWAPVIQAVRTRLQALST